MRQEMGGGTMWRNGRPARALAVAVVLMVVVGVSGCGRTSVDSVDVKATGLPRPQLVVVHDFAVSASAVALDTAIGARVMEALKGNEEIQDHVKAGREVAKVLTETLVKEVGKLGIPAVAAANATPVAGPSLQIEGQFVTVNEGNRLRRAVIGFGAGAS